MGCFLTGCLGEDRDGDGLPNSIETDGWPILVIILGETNKTEFQVSSDPDQYDTDDDGLSDYEEFMSYHTHPRKKDTDGDTLSDFDEVKIYSSDPTDGFHDIDSDYFWDGDEVLFFRKMGIDNETITLFLNMTDIDEDGIPDGWDKDPLQDLKINLTLHSINISGVDNDRSPQVWELYFRIICDSTVNMLTDSIDIEQNINYSLNLSWTLDLSDEGEPGIPESLLQLVAWDNDTTQDDLVLINNESGFWGTDDFIPSRDSGMYTLKGTEAILFFEIRDASIPYNK
jgi:hypothetical protein